MATGIIALVGTVLGLVFWLIKRHAAQADDPATQNQNRYEQIDKDIARADSKGATAHATDDLDELERLQQRKGN